MSEADFRVHICIDGAYEADELGLRLAVERVLGLLEATPPLALTITLTGSEQVRELNRRYAGIDSTTDVLAFGAEDAPYAVEPGDVPYIGDVVIAYPVAEEQACAAGQAVSAELQMLAIHGTLHLLGYDHDTPVNQAEMWALESAAMDAVRAMGRV